VYIGAITVGVPIFDFGAQLATVRAKRAQYFAEQARLGSVADDVTNDVVKIYQQIAALSEFILTLQGEIAKLDRDARVAASEQQQGVKPLLPSIDAELHLLGKRDDLDVLETSRLLLYAALQKATGGTWNWLP
jgi:outer membrane protein TolC